MKLEDYQNIIDWVNYNTKVGIDSLITLNDTHVILRGFKDDVFIKINGWSLKKELDA